MIPVTIEDWILYASALKGPRLRSQAIAVNTLAFVRALQEEGAEPSHVVEVLRVFRNRLVEDEQVFPEGYPEQYLSYSLLGETPV